MNMLYDLAKPLIQYLKENYHPYCTILITEEYVKLLETKEYVPVIRDDNYDVYPTLTELNQENLNS